MIARPMLIFLYGFSLFGLVSCAGPKSLPPPASAVQAPARWNGASGDAAGQVVADWWNAFSAPGLTDIVRQALAHNTDIDLAATRVQEARAHVGFADAQLLPSADTQFQGARDRDVNPGLGVVEEQAAGQGGVAISYDIDLFGRLAANRGAARAALLATQADSDSVRLAVAAQAARGYISLLGLDKQLTILRATLRARADEVHLVQRHADAGYGTRLDLARAQAAYHGTEQQIPAVELAISRQQNALRLLIGSNPGDITRSTDLDALSVPRVPPSLPSELLRRRPDIVAAEQRIVAADRSLDSVRAGYMPDIRLTATGGFVSSTLVTGSPLGVWALGGSVLAPILSFGRLQAQQDAASAERDRAAFNYRKTALTAFKEVEDALAADQRDAERERSVLAQRADMALAYRYASQRYRAGYSPYLDQIDAQRGLLATELAAAQAHTNRLIGAVTLYQALGGGWDSP